jgi:hypothetical protein
MRHDAEEFPDVSRHIVTYMRSYDTNNQTLAALIMHGAKLSQEEYNPIKQGFLDCIGKEGCYTVSPSHHFGVWLIIRLCLTSTTMLSRRVLFEMSLSKMLPLSSNRSRASIMFLPRRMSSCKCCHNSPQFRPTLLLLCAERVVASVLEHLPWHKST